MRFRQTLLHSQLIKFNLILRKAIHSKEGYDDILGMEGGTWNAGGCRILAESLKKWSKGHFKLYVVKRNDSQTIQHFVAVSKRHNICVDGDGAQTPEMLLYKMEHAECLPGPKLEPFRHENPDEIQFHVDKIKKTVSLLNRRLGSHDKWGF